MEYRVDWGSPFSLHNWIEKLDAVCTPSIYLSFICTSFFIGWVSTLLVLPPMSDKYGRKLFFQFGIFANVIVYYFVKETRSLRNLIIAQFFCGMLNSLRTTMGYVYLMELLPRHLQ